MSSRRRFRLDPDQRKWLKILVIVALLAYPMWLVGEQRCGWLLSAAERPTGGVALPPQPDPSPPPSAPRRP